MIQWFRHKLGAQNVKKWCSETLPSRGFFVLLQLFIQVLKPVWYYTQLPVRFENSYSWLWTTLKENTYMGYNFTGSVWITGLYRIPKAMNYISLVIKKNLFNLCVLLKSSFSERLCPYRDYKTFKSRFRYTYSVRKS